MSKKIILVYPSYDPDNPYPDMDTDKMRKQPIGAFILASYIKSVGFDVKLIDCRLYSKKHIEDLLLSESKDALCVGFSVMTSQIKHAYNLSKLLKQNYPELCLVWGGIHPTLYPEQSIKPDFIDFVIRGEGEYGFEKLLNYIQEGNTNYKEVENLVWLNNGSFSQNEVIYPTDINKIPDPDYSLLDMETYMKGPFWNYFEKDIERLFDISTSRGCPYNCTFCATTIPAFKKWRPLSAERVNNLIDIAVTRYGAKHIWFVDDFFFGDKKRIYDILYHLKEKKYDLTYEALTTVQLFRNYFTDDLLKLLRETGLIVLGMGIESGSERMLKLLRKPQTIDSIMHAIRRCKEFDIIPKPSFMTGMPEETDEETVMTLKLIEKIYNEWPRTSFYIPSIFRPYPGTKLYEKCIELGFNEPKSLEDWLSYKLHDNYFIQPKDLPWVKNPKFHINIPYIAFNYLHYRYFGSDKSYPLSRKFVGKLALFRFKHDFWKFNFEHNFTKMKKSLEKKPFLRKLIRKIT